MLDEGWQVVEGGIPEDAQEYATTRPAQCPGCRGWFVVVLQLDLGRDMARNLCATPHLASPAEAVARADMICDALNATEEIPDELGTMATIN